MSINKIAIFSILTMLLRVVYIFYGDVITARLNNVDLEKTLESTSNADSAYLGRKKINGMMDIIIYAIPKIIYFMFSPMPWYWKGIADMSSFITDSLIYLYLFYNIIKCHKYLSTRKKQIINLLLIGLILTIVVYALGTYTAGAAMRHRYKIFPYLVIITALCLNIKKETN